MIIGVQHAESRQGVLVHLTAKPLATDSTWM
jgi:hypothetical protein